MLSEHEIRCPLPATATGFVSDTGVIASATTSGEYAVLVRTISKTFSGVRALKNASLKVRAGEVHALLGTNGSGKSTLIKVLSGFHKPDDGADIEVVGRKLDTGSTIASHAAGLRFIHQDLGLIDTLTVEENFNLTMPGWGRWLSDGVQQSRVKKIFERYDIDLNPSVLVSALSPTLRALVAIVRAVEDRLQSNGVLVLDEPTAALPKDEVRHLFRIIQQLKARGMTIIYVSHRMPEILEIADRATVLRDGQTVATVDVGGLSLDSLVQLVLGYELKKAHTRQEAVQAGDVLLSVANLQGTSVRQFNLEARAGEVVGITGLLGSGYEEVLGLVFGATQPTNGDISIAGENLTGTDPLHRIRCGLAYAPADRRRLGSVSEWSVRENLTLPDPPSSGLLHWMSKRKESEDTSNWLTKMGVVPHNPEQAFATMSGGNQQKIVIARWLRVGSQVMLLDEPTSGVDAAAKRAVHSALRQSAAQGAAVVISSSDVEELIQLCDRVLVMGDGTVRDELFGEQLSDDALNASIMTATSTS